MRTQCWYFTGQSASVGVPNAWKIFFNWSISESPATYGVRSMSSAKIQPTAHISTAYVYSWAPNNNSGDRYHLCDKKNSAFWITSPPSYIPCYYLRSHLPSWIAPISCQAKISNLEYTIMRQQQVIWLHILYINSQSIIGYPLFVMMMMDIPDEVQSDDDNDPIHVASWASMIWCRPA